MVHVKSLLTGLPLVHCCSLSDCTLCDQITVGDAHGYEILAFQAIISAGIAADE